MTKKEFMQKTDTSLELLHYYKKAYSHLVDEDDYSKLYEYINFVDELKARLQNVLIDKSGKDVKEFFNSINSAAVFISRLWSENTCRTLNFTVILRRRKIAKKFNVDISDIDKEYFYSDIKLF